MKVFLSPVPRKQPLGTHSSTRILWGLKDKHKLTPSTLCQSRTVMWRDIEESLGQWGQKDGGAPQDTWAQVC